MLGLLVPGVGMGGGTGSSATPPEVCDHVDFEWTREDAVDFGGCDDE
jgi:hypothetical protein